MRAVTILGATGVIGQLSLDVIGKYPEEFSVYALTAFKSVDQLAKSCQQFRPKYAVINSQDAAQQLRSHPDMQGLSTTVLYGEDELVNIASSTEVDTVITGVVGGAGLKPTLAAIRAGVRVMIANKEPVVMLGSILNREVREHNATIFPVDSEHNAIFQCCTAACDQDYKPFNRIPGLKRILLTGSGGPFLTIPLDELSAVTPQRAVAHPVWNMGAKISVDSATMMNKGLEIIEARWLFNVAVEEIDVVIHPQGMIHSMVEYKDGSIIAQMASPDMRVPIANTLFWPERRESGAEGLDPTQMPQLEFLTPDWVRFPCLALAKEVARSDGTASTVMNAANEVAVDQFLKSRIRFTQIADSVRHCVETIEDEPVESLEHILEVDQRTRALAAQYAAANGC